MLLTITIRMVIEKPQGNHTRNNLVPRTCSKSHQSHEHTEHARKKARGPLVRGDSPGEMRGGSPTASVNGTTVDGEDQPILRSLAPGTISRVANERTRDAAQGTQSSSDLFDDPELLKAIDELERFFGLHAKPSSLDFHGGGFGPSDKTHLLGNPLFHRLSPDRVLAASMTDLPRLPVLSRGHAL
jgi:hypothetical protein